MNPEIQPSPQSGPPYPYAPPQNTRRRWVSGGAIVTVLFMVGLATWFFFFVPTQDERRQQNAAGHVDVISSDPAGIKDGKLETRCYTSDAPVGYATTSADGCAVVLSPREGGSLLTAVYVTQHWGAGKTLDQVKLEFTKNIEDMKKNNPKVKITSDKRTSLNGYAAWVIDYNDPYELPYRNYIIEAPEGKLSYNGQPLVAFSVTGYISEKQFAGSEPPVEIVANSLKFISN